MNAAFPNPTTFLGDYSGIDASQAGGTGGFTAALWADMRNGVSFPPRAGSGEDAFYATVP